MSSQLIRCAACGQQNRVPDPGPGRHAVCGKCRQRLDPPASGGLPMELDDQTFREGIAKGRSVVDFWAAWCGPCRAIAPIITALAAERGDIRFVKVDIDRNPVSAAAFAVQSIPLLVFMRDGRETGRLVGAVPRAEIEAAIRRFLE